MRQKNLPLFNRTLLPFLLLFFFQYSDGATVYFNYDLKYQTIEGFGGGLVFDIFPSKFNHPKKDAIYDSIFNEAGINIVRIGNWYNPQSDSEVAEVPMMLEIQKKWPAVKTMLTSWSPPPYLKNNNSTLGASQDSTGAIDTFTLKKNSDGTFMYDEYGDYWLQSVRHFQEKGVKIDWVSIQNEPDYPAFHQGCLLEAQESSTIPSYGKALNAAYKKFQDSLTSPPKFIGPDVAGMVGTRMSRFLTSADMNRDQLAAYCHHNYDMADPYWMLMMKTQFPDKPIYQTEYLINDSTTNYANQYLTWFDHAKVIHYMLFHENIAMYCLFALTYKPASTHCLFSIDTLGGEWFLPRSAYYMFKHYSKSIHRGWHRIASETNDTAILASAFSDPNSDSTAIIILNTSNSSRPLDFSFPGRQGEIHQTSNEVKYVRLDSFNENTSFSLPPKSITTIDFHINHSRVTVPETRTATLTHAIAGIRMLPHGKLSVRYASPSRTATISLFDIRGHLLLQRSLNTNKTGAGQTVLDCPAASGSYLLRLSCGNASVVRSFILSR